MDLETLLQGSQAGSGAQGATDAGSDNQGTDQPNPDRQNPSPSSPLSLGNGAEIQNQLKQLAPMLSGMTNGGLKKMLGGIWGIFKKVAEATLSIYGTESPEGKKVLKIIKELQSLSQGTSSTDTQTAVKSLLQALPQNMQSLDKNNLLEQIIGAGNQGMPPAGAGAGAGVQSAPPMGPMGPIPQQPQ